MVARTLMRSVPSSHICSIVFSVGQSLLSKFWPPHGLALVGTRSERFNVFNYK